MNSIITEERWATISLEELSMEKINLPFFYHLGAKLNLLTELTPEVDNRVQIWLATMPAHSYVYTLLESFSTLTVCRTTGIEFINAIIEVQNWMTETPPNKWGKEEPSVDVRFNNVIIKAKEFQTVLIAELETLASYYVTQKAIYSTTGLIERAENILPEHVLKKISTDIKEEIRQSGKCLAFDVATASAFHIMRATEAVIHKYYLHVCQPESEKRLQAWGAYITELKKSPKPEVQEVVAILQQIKDRHRNLIMHPEIVLSPDEAFTLFEIAKGAIIAMADNLPRRKKK